MDIHRSRFVSFPASPINAIAFSRSDDKGLNDPKPALKAAIGRADGSIEIWNPDRGNWVQELVFPGSDEASIDGLVWTQDPNDTDAAGKIILGQQRLFSIGSSTSAVTEWDLSKGVPLRSSTGNFSEVWCIASQPRWSPRKNDSTTKVPAWRGQDIVAGCGDGSLAILTTADDDLTFKRFLTRSGSRKTRCMSVTWQTRDVVVAGFSDGNIRVYDNRNGSLIRTMSLGAGIPGAPKDTLVWKVKCLPTGDIVSADSNGELRFWDGRTYSMTQRLSGHDSDCLDVVVSSDGQTALSGGLDGKIAVYKISHREGDKRRWAKLSHRRVHDGDIKSMAAFDSKQMSVVLTGGNDTIPIVTPFREYGRENFRRLAGLPQKQPCVSAPGARLLVSWWERIVTIWEIPTQDAATFDPDSKSRRRVLQLGIRGEEHICSVSISPDGKLLAVATLATTHLFALRKSKHSNALRARRVILPTETAGSGGRHVVVSTDSKWLAVVQPDNDVSILRIVNDEADHSRVLFQVTQLDINTRSESKQTGLKRYDETVNHATFSPDSNMLVISTLAGYIHAFTLDGIYDAAAPSALRVANKGRSATHTSTSDSDSDSDSDDEDLPIAYNGQTWQQHAHSRRLPKLDSAPLLMTFHPSPTSDLMVIITQHHQIYEFDMKTCKLSTWSRRNPTAAFPAELKTLKDRVMGCVWDYKPSTPPPGPDSALSNGEDAAAERKREHRLWLYGPSFLCMLDIRRDFSRPSAEPALEVGAGTATKRKRSLIAEDAKYLAHRRVGGKMHKGVSGAGDKVSALEGAGLDLDAAKIASTRDQDVDEDDDADMLDFDDEEKEDDMDMRDASDAEAEPQAETTMTSTDAGPVTKYRTGAGRDAQGRMWWCTFKYRPILGVVPLERHAALTVAVDGDQSLALNTVDGDDGGVDGEGVRDDAAGVGKEVDVKTGAASGGLLEGRREGGADDERLPVEVVLVERPVWELEHMRAPSR